MLFLHALLFSLLGLSALATPVPVGAAVSAATLGAGAEVKHLLKKKINGLWRQTKVSEHRSFYLTQY